MVLLVRGGGLNEKTSSDDLAVKRFAYLLIVQVDIGVHPLKARPQ